jgi:phosphate transport system protein
MERIHFQQELEALRMACLKMAALTQQAFEKSLKAYTTRDDALAKEIVAGDSVLNQMEIDIDEVSLRLLALEQPMAGDLRLIVGIMRISNELERIADQAVNIAERTIFLCQYPPLEPISAMDQLIDVSRQMVKKAIASLPDMNTAEAVEIRKMEDQADEYTFQVLRSLIELMITDAPVIDTRRLRMRRSIQTVILSRCLERAADLATNIGEHVAFVTEGIYIKHQNIIEKKMIT